MKDDGKKAGRPRNLRDVFGGIGRAIRGAIRWYNLRLSSIYSPNIAALTGALLVGIMAVILLFVKPCVGVADDGSLSRIMLSSGLGYRSQDLEEPMGAYVTRVLQHSTRQPEGLSTHRLIIRVAMWLDDQFTHDGLFDMRYLSAVYLILYLPAVYLVLRGIVARVKVASEATFLVILGAVILGDAGVLTYFNSLYPEPVWQILLMYCMGCCMALQYPGDSVVQAAFLGLMAAGSALALTEAHCAAAGLVLAVFCARQLVMEDGNHRTTVLAASTAVVLVVVSVLSMTTGVTRFNDTSKMHAMTNGVLLRAENPEQTLADFGIDARFETLTDASAYQSYPYALSGNDEIQRDFLSRYDTAAIALYYIRHPGAALQMLELGTKAALTPGRTYVGNYERSADMPPRSRNPLFVFYSDFKANTLPKTLGFLAILSIAYWALFRRRRGLQHFVVRWTLRERQIMLDTFLCLLAIGIADISTVLCRSGTAELERYGMLYGVCVDGALLMFAAEILHRLNILSAEDQENG